MAVEQVHTIDGKLIFYETTDFGNDYKYNIRESFGMRGELIIGPTNEWPDAGNGEEEEPEEYITDEDLEIDV